MRSSGAYFKFFGGGALGAALMMELFGANSKQGQTSRS